MLEIRTSQFYFKFFQCHRRERSLKRSYQALLLLFIVFGIYYPAIFSGFNLVDDHEVFGRLEDNEGFDITGLFLARGGVYYRPLTALTFYFDKVLWSLDPGFMHLENIALHAANVLLVFLIAGRIFADEGSRKFYLPLLGSLLFALHPINAEAVNWISGRYDLLAASFVLGSTLLIQKGVEARNYAYFILSSLSLFLGCLAKETALFFFPVAVFFVHFLSQEKNPPSIDGNTMPSISFGRATIPLAAALLSYFVLRLQGVTSGESPIVLAAGQIVQGAAHSIVDTFRIVFKLFGFYVKKLFIPVPLNFAIVYIHNAYVWVGIGALLSGFFLLARRTTPANIVLAGLFLISSGIAVTFSGAAWTPAAERYLYLPAAFFSIGITGLLFALFSRYRKETWMACCMVLLLALSAYATADRSLIWQSNLSLYQDTVRKSPHFKKLQNELAAALREEGRVDEADRLLGLAISDDPSHVFLYINQAELRLKQDKPKEARNIILASMKDKKAAHPEALKMLARIDEERLFSEKRRWAQIKIAREIIDTLDHLYSIKRDPFCLYRSGQLLLFLGQKQRAGEYFQRAYEKAPEGTHFKEPARKLAQRLTRHEK